MLFAIACKRDRRPAEELAAMQRAPVTTTHAESPYEGSAWGMSEGGRIFRQFNCGGCHSHGGGGMGPALMDDAWLYGSDPDAIYTSIVDGRPNGMPSFRGRVTEEQAWQLVSFVRSLSGLEPSSTSPGRNDEMDNRKPPSQTETSHPRLGKP
jgi:cytochrome c oxidase cbb3-type subunit 3